jgi:hypothetical protein
MPGKRIASLSVATRANLAQGPDGLRKLFRSTPCWAESLGGRESDSGRKSEERCIDELGKGVDVHAMSAMP